MQSRQQLRGGLRERGSQIVQASPILLPRIGIVFSIPDLALAILVKGTLQHLVREGVRFAVTRRCLQPCGLDERPRWQAIGGRRAVIRRSSREFSDLRGT